MFSIQQKINFMKKALFLAEKGLFSASPNPRVGCVLVDQDGLIIGEGFHQKTGDNHAEINAIENAKNRFADYAEKLKTATAFVTLEPCAHYGKTPPCALKLIDSGIKKVVIASTDPNPLVKGKGIELLKNAGVEVETGILQKEADWLNRAFFYRITNNRPYVTVKIASSLDGKIALKNGKSKWISNELARIDGHKFRLMSDAIIAGTGSVINDNARLSARFTTALIANQPIKVIIDSKLQTPIDAAVFADKTKVLIASSKDCDKNYPKNAQVINFKGKNNKVDLNKLLDYLGELSINHVLVEAGAGLASAFIKNNLSNEILLYIAPILLGDQAKSWFYADFTELTSAPNFKLIDSKAISDNWRFIWQKDS